MSSQDTLFLADHVNRKHLVERVAALRAGLSCVDPFKLAERTGAAFHPTGQGSGEFSFSLWGRPSVLPYPELVVHDAKNRDELDIYTQALVMYYFNTCDGVPEEGYWISFSELPDGRFYNQSFQGYTGKEIARTFDNDLAAFSRAAESIGGRRLQPGKTAPIGDVAYKFSVLMRVSLLAAYWLGDEDFPPSCQILFDAAVSHYLPTDACAMIGSRLTRRLYENRH